MPACAYCRGTGNLGPSKFEWVDAGNGFVRGIWTGSTPCQRCGATGKWSDKMAARFISEKGEKPPDHQESHAEMLERLPLPPQTKRKGKRT